MKIELTQQEIDAIRGWYQSALASDAAEFSLIQKLLGAYMLVSTKQTRPAKLQLHGDAHCEEGGCSWCGSGPGEPHWRAGEDPWRYENMRESIQAVKS